MHCDASGPTGGSVPRLKAVISFIGRNKVQYWSLAALATGFCRCNLWHDYPVRGAVAHVLFRNASRNTTPDRIPAFLYVTLEAVSKGPTGPWQKRRDVIPWKLKPNSYNSVTGSPGFILRSGSEYLQFVSVATMRGNKIFRSIAIASTQNLEGAWKLPEEPTLPLSDQIENTSLYYEPTIRTWFLFTDHIGIDQRYEYADAIWVYWSKDLLHWDPVNKAIVLDHTNQRWSKHVVGLPSLVRVGKRLAVFCAGRVESEGYDWHSDSLHMKRDIGLAWLDLPLSQPKE